MSGLAIYGMSGAILGIAFTGCNPTLAVVWLVIAFVFDGSFIAGFAVNQMELSPNYAGSIRGIVSTFSNMNGFLTPLVAAYFVDGNVSYHYLRLITFRLMSSLKLTFRTPYMLGNLCLS